MVGVQLAFPLASDPWSGVWKRRLLAPRGATRRCGPLDVCARARAGALELEVRCSRCGWSEGTGGCVDEWDIGAELLQAEVRDLLPGAVEKDHLGVRSDPFCQPAPDWPTALSAVWRKAFGAAMEAASAETIAACRCLHGDVRAACHYAIEADHSGGVLQLVEAQPVAAAVVAWAAARGERRRAWEPVVEGRPLREVLSQAAHSLGRDRPEQLRRLRWLVRNLPPDASPRDVMDAIRLPLVHTDLPATAQGRHLWLTAIAEAAHVLALVADLEILDCISRYVSRHSAVMAGVMDFPVKWSDLVDWMVETRRRPSRARDPGDLLLVVFVWSEERAASRRRQEATANAETLEPTGADLLPAPPWPAFKDRDFEVRPLVRLRDLLLEAQEMNHCLYDHQDALREGSYAAYSVRAGAHRATLMIARDAQRGSYSPPTTLRSSCHRKLRRSPDRSTRPRLRRPPLAARSPLMFPIRA